MNISGMQSMMQSGIWPGASTDHGQMKTGNVGGLNGMVTEANPETMKDVRKQSLFGDAITGNLIMMSSQKNLAEAKANIDLNAAKAAAPKNDAGEPIETEQVRQAARQVNTAENYTPEQAAQGALSKTDKLIAQGGAGIDVRV